MQVSLDITALFWHLANFFAAAAGLSLIATMLSRMVWRGALRKVSVLRLWAWTFGAAAIVSMAGLVVFGRNGKMATYAAMVVACSAVLFWFTSPRRE